MDNCFLLYGISVQLRHLVFTGDFIGVEDSFSKCRFLTAEEFVSFICLHKEKFVSLKFDSDHCCAVVICNFFNWD